MDNYTVYKHVSPSGKQYIGITKQDVEKRWSNGEGYKHCSYFYNAIQKYGWDNFEHIILYTNLSREKACEIEKNLIEELDLLNPEKGYNLKTGGRYGILTEESKKKISESLKGNKSRLGIPHTDETIAHMKEIRAGKNPHEWTEESREKMRQYRLGKKASKETRELLSTIRMGEKNSFYGKHHTEETKERIREANIGKKHSEESRKKMSQSRKGMKLSKEHSMHIAEAKKKQVIQLSLEDEKFIKEWDSVKSAMISLNIKHIDGVCRGERKSAGGYKWVYKEDYYARVNI